MEQRCFSWLSRVCRILVCLQRRVLKWSFRICFRIFFSFFVGMVVVESFSHFYQEIIAYWPIVIILTEHSLSSCIGTCSSKSWYLFVLILALEGFSMLLGF